ncbi:hypothetical protein ACGFNU_45590 [Spirillospora sp. NPDC048911]|uniref:hypothetical protein n=1 Tax=Spirillospora sp. NPDC048911 TaxID=3364527 RepID=UPI00371F7911
MDTYRWDDRQLLHHCAEMDADSRRHEARVKTPEDVALREHLVQLSDIQFDGARLGLLLSWTSFTAPRTSAFTARLDANMSKPWPELLPHAGIPDGGIFPSHEARRRTYWQPAANAPPALHLAWLLQSLASELWAFRAARLDLHRLDVVDAAYADIVVYRGALCTVRVQIADRVDPLDFPGVLIRESLEDHFRANDRHDRDDHRDRCDRRDDLIDLRHRL